MFVFFDRNGVIREVINDKSIRVGSVNANNIYIYVDGVTPDDVFVTTQWGDLTKTNEISVVDNIANLEIPYDKERDMKFFKNFKTYKFFVYKLGKITGEGEDITAIGSDGLARTTVRITVDMGQLFALGTLTYNIQESIIKDDYAVTQAQYDYLLTLVARNNLEIESIKYDATKVNPIEITAKPNLSILSDEMKDNFILANMESFINSKDIKDIWFKCDLDTEEKIGFELHYEFAQIGKLQVLINADEYNEELELKCYVTNATGRYLADSIIVPPMPKGVFAFYRFNIYDTEVSKIEILQEQGDKKDRFSIRAIESFALSVGQYIIKQKNGIISTIDNPDTKYHDKIYQYMRDNFDILEENVAITKENAQKTEEAKQVVENMQPVLNEVLQATDYIEETLPVVQSDLNKAVNTLKEINSQLNQPNGFVQLGEDGKVPASQLPFEKIVNVFAVSSENDLTTLRDANVGDVAYIVTENKITHSYRLVKEPYNVIGNWLEQITTFTNNSAYAERSGLADNSSKINGFTLNKMTMADFENLPDKTGVYIVTI